MQTGLAHYHGNIGALSLRKAPADGAVALKSRLDSVQSRLYHYCNGYTLCYRDPEG